MKRLLSTAAIAVAAFFPVSASAQFIGNLDNTTVLGGCLLYTSPSPRDLSTSRMPSSA